MSDCVEKRWMVGLLFVVLATGLSGCSLMFVQTPETASPRSECTTSQLAPVLDSQAAINSAFLALGGLAGAVSDVDLYGPIDTKAYLGVTAIGALTGGIATHSANKGFQRVRWCSEVRYTEAARRRPGGEPGRPARDDESEPDASVDEQSTTPKESPSETQNADRSKTRHAGPSEDDETSESAERDADGLESRHGDGSNAEETDESDSGAGDGEKCREAGSMICSDDTDCLGDDVCDPDKQRCMPEECVEGTP